MIGRPPVIRIGLGYGEELTDGKRTADQVHEEIEQTRQERGDTAAALAEKADVKAQARRAAGNARQTVAAEAHNLKDSVVSRENRPAAIALAALVGGYLLGPRRSR